MICFIKSIMTLNSKHIAKLQRHRSRNTRKQKHEKLKQKKDENLVLPKEEAENADCLL